MDRRGIGIFRRFDLADIHEQAEVFIAGIDDHELLHRQHGALKRFRLGDLLIDQWCDAFVIGPLKGRGHDEQG